jgi:hypothetical protein
MHNTMATDLLIMLPRSSPRRQSKAATGQGEGSGDGGGGLEGQHRQEANTAAAAAPPANRRWRQGGLQE